MLFIYFNWHINFIMKDIFCTPSQHHQVCCVLSFCRAVKIPAWIQIAIDVCFYYSYQFQTHHITNSYLCIFLFLLIITYFVIFHKSWFESKGISFCPLQFSTSALNFISQLTGEFSEPLLAAAIKILISPIFFFFLFHADRYRRDSKLNVKEYTPSHFYTPQQRALL